MTDYSIPLRYRFIIWASNHFIIYTLVIMMMGLGAGIKYSDDLTELWHKIPIVNAIAR